VQTYKILKMLLRIICCYLWIMPVYAEVNVQLLTPPTAESAQLSTFLSKNLPDSDVVITTHEKVSEKTDILIVMSNDMVKSLPANHPPTLFVLAQPSTIEMQKQDSALYWSPSLSAQLALIRAVLPATNRVGMLVSNGEDASWLRVFKQYAAEQSIEVRFQTIDKTRIARQVSELAASTDVLLAQPDTDIYNRETIRFILLAAYRQNKVLIGPSPAFVNAGALATLYAPSHVVAEEVAQKIQHFIKNNKLPPASRVKNLSVSLNAQVAKSLGLAVPAMNELERLLRLEELPTWP
jgi:putative ABC transport system substrate-binding protein